MAKNARKRPQTEGRDEAIAEHPFPSVEALRPHLGEWVAIDSTGAICAAGKTFSEAANLAERAGVDGPELLFIPPLSLVG